MITRQGNGFKARLVVVGCQEPKGAGRTESPTGSHLALMTALAFVSLSDWRLIGLDSKSAYAQAENLERIVLFRLPRAHPPPGCHPSQVVVALGAIYGARDGGRAFYTTPRVSRWRTASQGGPFAIAEEASPAPLAVSSSTAPLAPRRRHRRHRSQSVRRAQS